MRRRGQRRHGTLCLYNPQSASAARRSRGVHRGATLINGETAQRGGGGGWRCLRRRRWIPSPPHRPYACAAGGCLRAARGLFGARSPPLGALAEVTKLSASCRGATLINGDAARQRVGGDIMEGTAQDRSIITPTLLCRRRRRRSASVVQLGALTEDVKLASVCRAERELLLRGADTIIAAAAAG